MRRFWAHFRFCLFMVAMLLTACAPGWIRNGAYINEAKRFVVPLPTEGWNVEMGREPDLFFRHQSRQAGILVHATCGEIPPDRPLAIASRHLFFGIQRKEILLEEHVTANQGDGLDMVLRGSLGGRKLLLHAYTLRGPGCVYDLVLFANPERYAEANREFEAMVRHFQLLGAEKR